MVHTMHIYLLRHGIAEDGGPGLRDRDRALTDEGWKRLRKAAPAWRRLCELPEVVLVSPLRRAHETASVFCEALPGHGTLRTETALVPEAEVLAAARLLEAEQLAGTRSIALIGHEPHLGYLLGLLLTGHPRQSVPLKKGMLVGLETGSAASLHADLRFAVSQRAAAALA
jgi:phosphohistidine phosphatase